jgi:hypothetical protein
MGADNVDNTIENPNIVDPYIEKLTPVQISATDKFKGAADAFYELDDRAPDSLAIFVKSQKLKGFSKLRVFTQEITKSVRRSKNKMITKHNRKQTT